MFHTDFQKLDLADIATVLEEINPALQGVVFDPVETRIMALPLVFYPGMRLLDIIRVDSVPATRRFVVHGKGKVIVLDFTNAPIYALNAGGALRLDQNSVLEYARFFLAFVRGKHGRFLAVENVDDIPWKEEPPPNARKAIAKMITPITYHDMNTEGEYILQACLIFKNALFQSKIAVKKDGNVRIYDEMLLIEDMPILDDTFGQ